MKIITDLDFKLKNTAVCIGKFDGLHRGHQSLFEEAGKQGRTRVMMTFSFPEVRGIYSDEEKIYLAERAGIDIMVVIQATEEFLHMSPGAFTDSVRPLRCQGSGRGRGFLLRLQEERGHRLFAAGGREARLSGLHKGEAASGR